MLLLCIHQIPTRCTLIAVGDHGSTYTSSNFLKLPELMLRRHYFGRNTGTEGQFLEGGNSIAFVMSSESNKSFYDNLRVATICIVFYYLSDIFQTWNLGIAFPLSTSHPSRTMLIYKRIPPGSQIRTSSAHVIPGCAPATTKHSTLQAALYALEALKNFLT